jgi:hypothetical protein
MFSKGVPACVRRTTQAARFQRILELRQRRADGFREFSYRLTVAFVRGLFHRRMAYGKTIIRIRRRGEGEENDVHHQAR